jgi:outer membrane autotransporter protein
VTTGAGTTVTGGQTGIRAYNTGSGAVTVTANGDVAGTTRDGIFARNNSGTDLAVTTGASTNVTGLNRGIYATNVGSGTLTVTANGDVTGTTLYGIYARNYGIDLEVTTGAGTHVTGGNQGIYAINDGSGTLTVTANGNITGTTYDGINAQSVAGGPINITVGAASAVTSNGAGADHFAIDVRGGPGDVTVAGTLNGGAGGAVQFDQGTARDDRLELQPAATVNGNVLAGPGTDTLAFGGDGNGAFNLANIDTGGNTQQYQNFEVFEVDGGTWSFSGATTQDFTVNGGTLGGTGTFGNLTINGGTVAPGNSIGTMTVNGAFTLGSGAVYEVEVNAAGQSDKVIVNGTVNLTGATLRVLAANGNYKTSTDYTIIENDGADAVVGKFSTVTSSLAFLTPTVFYTGGDGNDVVLNLERNETLFPDVARTFNQRAVAGALEQFPADNPLFLAVLNQTEAGARQAFDALSGEIHATVSGTLADDSRYVREAVLGRLIQASHSGEALSAGGPQVASLDQSAMALGYDGKSLVGPERAPLAFWTRAYGAWGDFDGDGNAATADRDLGGFVSGMDASIGSGWRAGLATGASFANVSVDDRHSAADVESYTLGGYVGGMAGAFALRGGGMWAWNEIDTSRAVVFPGFFERQKANYDADTGQLFGEVAYPTQVAGIALEPFGGLALVSIDGDSFRERGGALASLRGSSTDEDVGYSTLGLRAATTMHWGATLVTPHVSAAWQHAFDDVTPGAALAFASTGIGFGIEGVPLAEDSALIDAGLDFALGETTTAGVSYTGQFGDGVSDNGVKGRFTWLF